MMRSNRRNKKRLFIYCTIIAFIVIYSFMFSSCSKAKTADTEIMPNQDNLLQTMQEHLSKEDIEKIQKGYERYLTIVEANRYSGVKGVLKAYLDLTNEYDYNQERIKFTNYYASLTKQEKIDLYYSYTTEGKFFYYFDGSKYNAYYDNTTVCLGFSDILEDYLEKKGYSVEPIVVEGHTLVNGKLEKAPNHKFLKVEIEGMWYYINPGSDYDGNINSFNFLLTSKDDIKRAFANLGSIYVWDEDDESPAKEGYPRRDLIKAFLEIREDELEKEYGIYINIDRAIKEYVQHNEEYVYIDQKKFLVVDEELFDILKDTEVFSQFNNLYLNMPRLNISYRRYKKTFSSFPSADIMFSDAMEKEEIQKIQKAYLDTRVVGMKTRVEYPFEMTGLSRKVEDALQTLLSSDRFKPIEEGKVKFTKYLQINMNDSRISEFEEKFKYLYMLENLDLIYINNQSQYDIFQIQSLKDSKIPVYYSCKNPDINYGLIENKVYLKSTKANMDLIAKSLQGKGDVVVINKYQSTDDILYVEEYDTTDLDTAIEQSNDLYRESGIVEDYVQGLCDNYLNDDSMSNREEAIDIYKDIENKINEFIKSNDKFERSYYNAKALVDVTEEGYERYRNEIVNDIIDFNFRKYKIKVFRNDDIVNVIKDNAGIINIRLKNNRKYRFDKVNILKVITNWDNEDINYIFEDVVLGRIRDEINQDEIKYNEIQKK